MYRRYLLGLLMVIYAYNFADRLALGLLGQYIKLDLSLSDSQLGVLSGIAFGFLYALMGIPLARWADRGNRVTIISLTTALWSAFVFLSGLATSYTALLFCRAGTAVGEAGCIPPAHSLISDHFTRAERPRALAIHMLGGSLSVLIGYFAAGWLNEFYGWRTTFVLLGLPGLLLAGLARLTLREPRCSRLQAGAPAGPRMNFSSLPTGEAAPALSQVALILWRSRTFRHLCLCFALAMFFNYAIVQWQSVFFMRTFGLESGTLGTWFAAIYAVCGVSGAYLGGWWASRRAAMDEARQLRLVSLSYFGFGLCAALTWLSPSEYWAFCGIGAMAVVGGLSTGPLFATIQALAPENMRATATAVIFLFVNLIGLGLGPLATGVVSDLLRAQYANDSLRYALLLWSPGFGWSAWHAWRASVAVGQESRLSQSQPSQSQPSGGGEQGATGTATAAGAGTSIGVGTKV